MAVETTDVHRDLARRLLEAERSRSAIAPLSEERPDLTIADAYEIQRCGRALQLEAGRRIVGRKIGLTSRAMQEMLGVDQPDYGVLYDSMLLESGATADSAQLVAPRVEAEVAFVLDRPVAGPDATADDVLAATGAVLPAIEVIDSRIADWRLTIVDTIADNASSALAVLGERRPPDGIDLAAVEMVLEAAGERAEGRGDAVLGHPATAVAWLADALADYGERLEPGDVVLSGALSRALPVRAGDTARADFGPFGEVTITFG